MNFERYSGAASAIGVVLMLLIVTWLGLWGPLEVHSTAADLGEFIKVISSIATGAAAVTGAAIAWRGLEKWRTETIGKKRYELAAAVLADFYEMEEIIRTSRGAFVLAHEIAEIVEDGVDQAKAVSYAPEQRLLKHQEFFAKFRSRKFEVAAYFGKAAAALFEDMWRIRLEINWAVGDMMRDWEVQRSDRPEDLELWLSWRRVVFADPREGKNPIAPRLSKIVVDVEAFCRPAIEAQNRL